MRFWPLLLWLAGGSVHAATAVCHVTYGGETRTVVATPSAAPLTVPVVTVGSYFLFRLVFEADGAIKTYVYADRDGQSPLPLHQAVFPLPRANAARFGFSGLHFVYEPLRDGELEYWCERR